MLTHTTAFDRFPLSQDLWQARMEIPEPREDRVFQEEWKPAFRHVDLVVCS
jgi:hypothetical protein